MLSRVSFVLGACSMLAALPCAARAGRPPAGPDTTKKPHVHGANGVVLLPEHRLIEWQLEELDGPEFRLSAYRGMVAFVHVFATWCGPCRAEQPAVVTFAGAHPEDTVVIGVDVGEEDNTVRAYRKQFGIAYPIAIDRYDKKVRSMYRQGRMTFPTTIVFRPDGMLSCAWAGEASREWFEYERRVALGTED